MVSYACHVQISLVEMIGWLHSQRQYYSHPRMNSCDKNVLSFVLQCSGEAMKSVIVKWRACSMFSTLVYYDKHFKMYKEDGHTTEGQRRDVKPIDSVTVEGFGFSECALFTW